MLGNSEYGFFSRAHQHPVTRPAVTRLAPNGLWSQGEGSSTPLSFDVMREEQHAFMKGRRMGTVQAAPLPTSKYNSTSILDMLRVLKYSFRILWERNYVSNKRRQPRPRGRRSLKRMCLEEFQNLNDDLVRIAADRQRKAK